MRRAIHFRQGPDRLVKSHDQQPAWRLQSNESRSRRQHRYCQQLSAAGLARPSRYVARPIIAPSLLS